MFLTLFSFLKCLMFCIMECILATFQGKRLYLLLAIKLIYIVTPPQVTINIFKGQEK